MFSGGVIGGVQNSLNSAMDTIKFILVIILPHTETYGWLIMASFTSVCLGAISYISYVFKHSKNTTGNTKDKKSEDVLPQAVYQATKNQEESYTSV